MIHVIATIELKPEYVAEFIKIFKANVGNVRAEAGCLRYEPCIDVDSGLPPQGGARPNVVTVVESWESMDHLRAHLKAPHMLDYVVKTKEMKISTKLQIVEPV